MLPLPITEHENSKLTWPIATEQKNKLSEIKMTGIEVIVCLQQALGFLFLPYPGD